MNIWIINHYAVPPELGAWSRHYYFSEYMINQGINVDIFTSAIIHISNKDMSENNNFITTKNYSNVPYHFIKGQKYSKNGIARIKNLLGFAWSIRKLKNYKNDKGKPDIIYCSSPDIFSAIVAARLANKKKCKLIVEIRDLWPESIVSYTGKSRNHIIIRILYCLEKWLYKKADRIIFLQKGTKQYITDKGWQDQIDVSKCRYVNNGVDLHAFDYNKANYIVDDSDLNDETTFKAVFTGSIGNANDVETIIDMAIELKKQKKEKEVVFLLYGTGLYLESLKEKCIKNSINNVKFKGNIEKKYIPYLLSKSDINILSCTVSDHWKYGGSQNKLFEYLASGKPIFTTVEMGYSQIKEYNCGFETNSRDVSYLVKELLKFKYMSKEEYNNYCNGALRGAKDYNYQKLSNDVFDICNELYSENKRH